MAKIKVTSKCELYDGISITFRAPCASSAVDGLNVYYNGTVQSFSFRDSHGNGLAGLGNLFSEGAYITAVLDTRNGYVYLQNVDTNGYLESQFAGKANSVHSHDERYYTKAENLSTATMSSFGLGTDATPNDVFSYLSPYSQYWWKRRKPGAASYAEQKGEAKTYTIYGTMSGYVSKKYYYSSSISFDSSGKVSLVSPSTLTTGTNFAASKFNSLKGKYFYTDYTPSIYGGYMPEAIAANTIYYCGSSSTVTKLEDFDNGDDYTDYYYTFNMTNVCAVTSVYSLTQHPFEYLHSTNRKAYSDSGTVSGYEYQYLGIPFDNSIDPAKIETGSYTGTASSFSLNFTFVPKLVIFAFLNSSAANVVVYVYGDSSHARFYSTGTNISGGKVTITASGNSLSVPSSPLGLSGKTYRYVAFG